MPRGPRTVERHLTLTTLGIGASGQMWKSLGTQHNVGIETGSPAVFDKHCDEVLTWCSDQGADFQVPVLPKLFNTDLAELHRICKDALADKLGTTTLANIALYRNCIRMPDVLHVMFGAFEDVVTNDPEFERTERALIVVALFMGEPDLEMRMVECVRDKLTGFGSALLSGWRCAKQFAWKWQYIIRFLVPLIRTLPTLQATYSADVVAAGKGPVLSINAKLVYEFGEAIRTPNLITSCMVLFAMCSSVDKQGHLV